MPARPANISGTRDMLPTVNQLIRELQIRIDNLGKVIPIHRILAGTGTLNFGSIPGNQAVSRNIQVSGASQGSSAQASPQLDLGNPHLVWSAFIPSSGVVTVRLLNPTNAPFTPNSVKWNVGVVQ